MGTLASTDMEGDQMDFPKVKTWAGQPVQYIQDKLDGFALVVKDGRATTRKKGVDHWPKLPDHLQTIFNTLPRNTIIMGELYWSGPATSIPTLLNDRDDRLKFSAFAMPMLGGDPITAPYRDVLESLTHLGFNTPRTMSFIQGNRAAYSWIITLKTRAVRLGVEGYVLKNGHMEGWYKVKPTKTVDAVVVGYTISESITHGGGLKAVQVALDGVVIASVGSGFIAEYRASVNMESLIGQVCEVEYDSVAANGKLRFPRFVRWRTDKGADECTMNQL